MFAQIIWQVVRGTQIPPTSNWYNNNTYRIYKTNTTLEIKPQHSPPAQSTHMMCSFLSQPNINQYYLEKTSNTKNLPLRVIGDEAGTNAVAIAATIATSRRVRRAILLMVYLQNIDEIGSWCLAVCHWLISAHFCSTNPQVGYKEDFFNLGGVNYLN